MRAYYNEIDPYAAAWLRNLIAAGHVAPGEVDERSIADVQPSDLVGFTQCHFFAGIGVWSYALRLAGWPDDRAVWTGSCPCQPFSAAGKRRGFQDERHLWPAWARLIAERAPVTIFGEQVADGGGLAWFDAVQADLEDRDYAVGAVVLPAASVGAPHGRHRLFFVADHQRDGLEGLVAGGAAPGTVVGGRADGVADAGRPGDERERGRGHAHGPARAPEGEARERQRGGPDAGDRLAACELADATSPRSARGEYGGADRSPARERLRLKESARDGAAGGVAHADSSGRREGEPQAPPQGREQLQPAGSGEPHDMADADGGGREGAGLHLPERGSLQAVPDAGGRGAVDELGDAESGGRRERRHSAQPGSGGHDSRPGPANGFWADAEWLYCRDGAYRAAEPGTFPLAHGAPARMGRLRAYGNAIVGPAATAFIEAYMLTRPTPERTSA